MAALGLAFPIVLGIVVTACNLRSDDLAETWSVDLISREPLLTYSVSNPQTKEALIWKLLLSCSILRRADAACLLPLNGVLTSRPCCLQLLLTEGAFELILASWLRPATRIWASGCCDALPAAGRNHFWFQPDALLGFIGTLAGAVLSTGISRDAVVKCPPA